MVSGHQGDDHVNKRSVQMLVIDERPSPGFLLMVGLIVLTTLTLTIYAVS